MSRQSVESDAALVLVVDDDPLVLRSIEAALSAEHFRLQTARSARQAFELWDRQRPDVLVLDNLPPDSQGLALLAQFRERDASLPVIFMTARGGSQTAIDAMKLGAFDFLAKPLDLSALESQVRLASQVRRLMRMPVVIAAEAEKVERASDGLIGRSPGMAEVYKAIGRAAGRDISVLLAGERGTGKALVARAIYQNSSRAEASFLTLKCSDYTSQQLEAELFGSEEGAAVARGCIEQNAGGTLLLEEIGETSPHLQSRLLRLLTTGQFERVGGTEALTADVRLFAAASQNLEELVTAGRFRSDLYYRLRSLAIHLPPLRERVGDVPLLVDHYIKRFSRLSRSYNASAVRISPEAMQLLSLHDWPGNLDELQSVLQQALIEHMGAVLPSRSLQQLLESSSRATAGVGDRATDWQAFLRERIKAGTSTLYAESVAEMERQLMPLVLEETSNNQAKSARLLGITRGNLRKKLRTLGLAPASALADDDNVPVLECDDAAPL
jgi:two-component system nitrogen regulation response regulator GlnG